MVVMVVFLSAAENGDREGSGGLLPNGKDTRAQSEHQRRTSVSCIPQSALIKVDDNYYLCHFDISV